MACRDAVFKDSSRAHPKLFHSKRRRSILFMKVFLSDLKFETCRLLHLLQRTVSFESRLGAAQVKLQTGTLDVHANFTVVGVRAVHIAR